MKLYTDEEFEAYAEAAHKAGVVFSVGSDGVVRAEYDPALAKCVASWDADGEIEQPMPDKADERAPSSSDTAGTEAAGQTVAGRPALASGVRIHDLYNGSAHCIECAGPCRLPPAEFHLSSLVRFLIESVVFGTNGLNHMMLSELRELGVDVEWAKRRAAGKPSAPDSTRKRDGVAGDVQPLRPREQ